MRAHFCGIPTRQRVFGLLGCEIRFLSAPVNRNTQERLIWQATLSNFSFTIRSVSVDPAEAFGLKGEGRSGSFNAE